MNAVTKFEFHGNDLRTLTDETGTVWFVAKDVAVALGYVNTNDAISSHCKGVANHYPLYTSGGKQDVRVIHEPDLYRLIIKSNLPEAQEFERWVFEEVLPTIRKTGQYSTTNPNNETAITIQFLQKEFEAAFSIIEKRDCMSREMAFKHANFCVLKTYGIDLIHHFELDHGDLNSDNSKQKIEYEKILLFIQEYCEQCDEVFSSSKTHEKLMDLYSAYVDWVRENEKHPIMKQSAFFLYLKKHFGVKVQRKNQYFIGVKTK